MNLQQEWLAIIDALHRAGIEYAVCGGFAVAMHGYPRLTTDIDFIIRTEDLDRVRVALANLGYRLDSGLLTFAAGQPSEQSLWRVSRVEGPDLITVDLLLVGSFLQDVWDTREHFAVGARRIAVVSRRGLLKMKRAAAHNKDRDDIEQLRLESDPP
jgi:hypothetical protein